MHRLIIAVPIWVLTSLLRLLLILIGWALIPTAAFAGAYKKSKSPIN
jgi:hypothetical protein